MAKFTFQEVDALQKGGNQRARELFLKAWDPERNRLVDNRYDTEATYFDEGVRSSKRKHLEEKLLQLIQPAYQSMLGHIRSGTLDRFKEAFENTLNEGKEFSVAARDCTDYFMAQFDEASAVHRRMLFQKRD